MEKIITLLFISLFFINFGCSKDPVTPPPSLDIAEEDLIQNFPAISSSKTISYSSTSNNIKVICDASWCNILLNEDLKKLQIKVEKNPSLDIRKTEIELQANGISQKIKIIQLGTNPVIILNKKNYHINFKNQSFDIPITTNIDLDISISKPWIKKLPKKKNGLVDLIYSFEAAQLIDTEQERTAKIIFKHADSALSDTVKILQSITIEDDYSPNPEIQFEKDKKLNVINAILTPSDQYQSGENIEKSIDNNTGTLYHSQWSGMEAHSPLELEYLLESESPIANYIVLHPRTSGINGIIKHATIWISTKEEPDYKQVATLDAPKSNNPQIIQFNTPIINPSGVKIIVTDSYSQDPEKYYVSLAEFEIYESRSTQSIEEDAQWFSDNIFSELKDGTTLNDVANMKNLFIQNIATYMIAKKYSKEYRVQEYKPYRNVHDLAQELKTSAYSQFENPTGIFFSKDEDAVLFVEDTDNNINLRVTDFGKSGDDYSYPLKQGLNIITMKGKGNGYISYYPNNYKTAKNIKIHIASGKINGVFNIKKHSNIDGQKLLDNAVSEIMDIIGNRVQLAYSVNSLRNYSYNSLSDLVVIYDSIISSQQTIMGLQKYNRLPENHMFGRVIWDGYMHADGWGAAFHDNTMKDIANPERLKNNIWGPAHEFGHVNQTRPGLVWVGTTEVTNNLFSKWIQFCYTPHNMRLEHENVGGLVGGRFNSYFNNAFLNKQEWCLQSDNYGPDENNVWGGDVFISLAPLWQLQLFFHISGEGNDWYRPYFYADVFEAVRNTNENGVSHGQLQMNFVKNVCDAVGYNLTDFFTNIGMLREVDKIFGDYTTRRKTITKEMIEETKSYISQYPKPELFNTIQYISVNSYETYKYRKKIEGQFGEGIYTLKENKKINHSIWKNVIAFETYKDKEITHITMVGTGSKDNIYTIVPFPDSSTKIMAIGYNGEKTLVYEE